jgi:L-ascorbate metabolism protein UlaG (beta-lactamase superfamily)
MKTVFLMGLFALTVTAQPNRLVEEFSSSEGTIRITPVRHASVMIEGGGAVIHLDPWSQGNYQGLPQADLILITDVHGDHLDAGMIRQLKKFDTVIMGPEAIKAQLGDMNVTVIRNGETKTVGKWAIEAVPMYNLKRGPAEGKVFHEKGRGNGYVLSLGGKRFYFSGDTEGVPEMRALKNIDVAFVCMNLPYTMPPEEAAEAVRAFKPGIVYPYHYRNSDLAVFEKGLSGSGVEVRVRNWYY